MMGRDVYYLGIDGGGTGCRARVTDAEGRVLGEGRSGPATLRLGAEAAWSALMAAADGALAEAHVTAAKARVYVGVGLAGLSRAAARDALVARPHPFARLVIVSDAETACLGAHGGADGGIVIAGTGSIAFALVDGRQLQIGGHGFPVSDSGSGADIGLEAVRAALRAHDGLEAQSQLSIAILVALGGDPTRAVAWMDRATATDYAALVPMVVAHAQAGDATGERVMQAAGASIAALLDGLFAQRVPRVALLGGLAAPLTPWLPHKIANRLAQAQGDGVDGALLCARRSERTRDG
jgi:glucosamine kinase